jgi:hypothetical protein
MSLYNLIHGMNASQALLLSPFLPTRCDNFPRFRNVFTNADDTDVVGDIYVYTRVGGGNRECWEDGEREDCDCSACESDRIESDDRCIHRYDDDFDSTYTTFVFKVSDDMRADYEKLLAGDFDGLSDKYKKTLRDMFPDSADAPNTSAIVNAICGA